MGAQIYKNKKLIWIFLLPAFLFMFVYLYYPFVRNILNSFMHIKYMGTAGGEWNSPWYKNYLTLLSDPKMKIALKNTAITIVATIIGQVGIALILALLVSNIKRGSGFFRTVFFFPIVISATALGVLFNLIFLGGFFKTAYKIGRPFVIYIIVGFVLIFVFEALHHVPGLEALNSFGTENMGLQLILLIAGAVLFIIMTGLSYKSACKNFEKIDLQRMVQICLRKI